MPNSQATSQHRLTSTTGNRLSLWLNKLPTTSVPIAKHNAGRTLELLHSEQCDSNKLAAMIKQDPMLCLKLYHHTRQALGKREGKESDIQHLVHLIGLIGLNQIEHTIVHSQQRPNLPTGLQEILAASLFAAQLSSTLLINKHTGHQERFYLPCLLFNAPLWFMWLVAPKAMAQGQQMASQGNIAFPEWVQEKLGFDLWSLLEKTESFASLPDMTLKALMIKPTNDLRFWARLNRLDISDIHTWFSQDKSAKRLFYSTEMGVYLLNYYVLALYLEWEDKYTERYGLLLSRHLGIDQATLEKQVREIAKKTRSSQYTQGLLAPINRLQGLHKTRRTSRQKTSNTLAKPSAWEPAISSSHSIDEALETTSACFIQGLKAQHCIIFHIQDKQIKTHWAYGYSPDTSVHSLDIDYKVKGSLIYQLLLQPASILLEQDDLAKAAQRLPDELKGHCIGQACAFISLFKDDKPTYLIYCDKDDWGEKEYLHFKRIAKSFNKKLHRI